MTRADELVVNGFAERCDYCGSVLAWSAADADDVEILLIKDYSAANDSYICPHCEQESGCSDV